MTGIASLLLAGGALGVKHAFEADHVAAVATLVDEGDRPASTGAAWGVGHSLPIVALGALSLALDLRVPRPVGAALEVAVAAVLVALGVRVIAGREALGAALLRHVHPDGDAPDRGPGDRHDRHDHHDRHSPGGHRHVRDRDGGHLHVNVGGRGIGLTHSHADEESFAVGIVHGLAGSGGIVIALAAAAPTVSQGAAFLSGFTAATVLAMGVAAWGWGRVVGHAAALRTVAGLASVAVGLSLLAGVVGVSLPPFG